jgi:hypothetical protein
VIYSFGKKNNISSNIGYTGMGAVLLFGKIEVDFYTEGNYEN